MILNKSYEILCQLKKKNPVLFVVVETFGMVVVKGVTDFDHWYLSDTDYKSCYMELLHIFIVYSNEECVGIK